MGTSFHEGKPIVNSAMVSTGSVANVGVELCLVCGDRASGRHYGAISCEGCKGFFKRSIRKQLGYQCRGTMNCEVTKHHRNRCQFCRLQKCIASGMRSDSVQHERKPILDKKEGFGTSPLGSMNSSSSAKPSSPVYHHRTKNNLFNRSLNPTTPVPFLDNITTPGVFPLGMNIAELTQTLLLASQQNQISSQFKSPRCHTPEPELPNFETIGNEDDNSVDETISMQHFLNTPSNNNSQSLNLNAEPLLSPSTTLNLIQTSLNKRIIDKALQKLDPISNHFENGLNSSVTILPVKKEMVGQEVEDGDSFVDPDDLEFKETKEQKHFVVNECIFAKDLINQLQAQFNLQAPTLLTTYFNIPYVCESGSRIIFLSIYWLCKVEAFDQLNSCSQIILLRSAWPGLLALALAQTHNLSVSTIFSTLVHNVQQLAKIEKIDPLKIRKMSEHIATLHAFVKEIGVLSLNDMEFAMMRLIYVFNPQWLSNRPKQQCVNDFVKRVRLYAMTTLRRHIYSIKSDDDAEEHFNSIILNLMPLSALESDVLEELFFANLVGQVQIDNMIPYILTLTTNSGI